MNRLEKSTLSINNPMGGIKTSLANDEKICPTDDNLDGVLGARPTLPKMDDLGG